MAPANLPTLLLFLFCLSQSFGRYHPLDPLTPSEISTIRSVIKSSHLASSKSLAFHYVGLDEPDKPDVLAWQSGRRATLPRRAFVIARADGQIHKLYIDISNNISVTSDKIYDGFGYPRINKEEEAVAYALPFNYTPFVEWVRKRGLQLKDIVCLGYTVGWYGEERQGRRLVNLLCFVTGDTVNLYMRPLEGVTMLVDLDAMEIVDYKDRRWFRCRRRPGRTTECPSRSRRSGRRRSLGWWSSRKARGSRSTAMLSGLQICSLLDRLGEVIG